MIVMLAMGCGASQPPDRLDVGVGSVQAPPGFQATHAEATDAMAGSMTDGRLEIGFSIGAMAGTQMHAGLRSQCSWFEEQPNGMETLRTACLLADGGGRHFVVSVVAVPFPGAYFPANGYPANFWADVDDEAQRAEVLAIADSYRPSGAVENLYVWISRGIERRSDSAEPGSGTHPAMSMEVDPVAVQPTQGRVLGSHATWNQRGADGAFHAVLETYRCDTDLRQMLGPPGVPEHDLQVDVVVFETGVPCGSAWEAFADPAGEGYRELVRASVPRIAPR